MRPSYRGRTGAVSGAGKIINLVDDTSGDRMSHLMGICFSPYVYLLQAQLTRVPRSSCFSPLWSSSCIVHSLFVIQPLHVTLLLLPARIPHPRQSHVSVPFKRISLLCTCCTREFSLTSTYHITNLEKKSSSDSLYAFPPDLNLQLLPLLGILVF